MTPPVEDVPQLDGVVAPLAVVPGRLLLLAVGLLFPAPGPAVLLYHARLRSDEIYAECSVLLRSWRLCYNALVPNCDRLCCSRPPQ